MSLAVVVRTLVGIAVCATALVPRGSAVGAQGDLDTTFDGDGGRSLVSLITADALASQPDGKIVVVGLGPSFEFAVGRLNPDGSDDGSFGIRGTQTVVFSGFTWPRAVALQADGKIVVAGGSSNLSVARLNPNGSPDVEFGTRTLDLGGAQESAEAIAIQPDGKIVVAGYGGADKMFVVARLEANGSLDASFGDAGIRRVDVVPVQSVVEESRAAALQSDGKIVVVGETQSFGQTRDIAVARLNANGSPDSTFGSGGVRTIDFGGAEQAQAVTLQLDGKILVAHSFGAMRLHPNGSSDANQPVSSGRAEAVAPLQNGKILVAGEGFRIGSVRGGGIGRLLPTLQLDESFGGPLPALSGLRTINEFGALTFYAMAMQWDGRIVLAGYGGQATVVRLHGDAVSTTQPGPGSGTGVGGGTTSAPAVPLRCAGRVATIVGTDRRDVLRGTRRADVIVGLGGDDVIRAGGGNDLVCGGPGRDRLLGQAGSDRLFGQLGRDTLLGGRGRDVLVGGQGRDACLGGLGRDRESCEIRPEAQSTIVGP